MLKALFDGFNQSKGNSPSATLDSSREAVRTVACEAFKSDVLNEVVRYLTHLRDYQRGVVVSDFEVRNDLSLDVLLAASYFQIA
jgi:hypothetical protein